jgi:hypothetical protein
MQRLGMPLLVEDIVDALVSVVDTLASICLSWESSVDTAGYVSFLSRWSLAIRIPIDNTQFGTCFRVRWFWIERGGHCMSRSRLRVGSIQVSTDVSQLAHQ